MSQIKLGRSILGANELIARKNRTLFAERGVLVINMMSSPGSGKTTILERTLENLSGQLKIGVIEGDLYTDQDAARIEAHGVPVVQINTEGGCHLDAAMVGKAYKELAAVDLDLIVIENVGNLVCPAEFELGEDFKVAVISVTEGDDKVSKYPLVFRQAAAILVNKTDLLPYIDFDLAKFNKDIRNVNSQAPVFMMSARTGENMAGWFSWLVKEVKKRR